MLNQPRIEHIYKLYRSHLHEPGLAVARPRGELLCQAFEVHHEVVTDPQIGFEHLVFLVSALTGGQEPMLAHCELCGALTVIDRMSFKPRHCFHCLSRTD